MERDQVKVTCLEHDQHRSPSLPHTEVTGN